MLTPADKTYEEAELTPNILTDTCYARFFAWQQDGYGGRLIGMPNNMQQVPCRLESNSRALERTDADGVRVVPEYVLSIPRGVDPPSDYLRLGAHYAYDLIFVLTVQNGIPCNRFFRPIAYTENTGERLRTIEVREIL